jgi:hypothetical protein
MYGSGSGDATTAVGRRIYDHFFYDHGFFASGPVTDPEPSFKV